MRPLVSRFITLAQLMVLFWIGSSLSENYEVSKSIMLSFVTASAVLATATLLRLPGFYASGAALGGRVTSLDVNPNAIGEIMAEGAVALIGLHISRALRFGKTTLLLSIPLLILLVQTGSRAAISGFVIGSSVYLLLIWRSKRKLWSVGLAALGLVALIYIVSADPLTLERIRSSYYQGDVSGRDTIFSAAVKMIQDRPIFGWHPIELWYQLGLRVGTWERDAHNLFLHLLLEVGLVGTLPFLIGLGLCVWAAWKASAGNLGLVFLALLLTLLVNNLAGTGLATKSFWLILALAVGAAGGVNNHRRQLSVLRKVHTSLQSSIKEAPLPQATRVFRI
ncbi:MAG: O-antigen ligase family protein [Alphaproteobacteria bacterium]